MIMVEIIEQIYIYDKCSTSSSTADHRDSDKHSTDYGGEHWTYIMANAALVWLIAVTVTNTVRIMVENKEHVTNAADTGDHLISM